METTQPRKPWTAASINFLTQDETRRLLDAIDSKCDYTMFLLAYRHGLRASEIGILTTADLNLKQYRLRIHRLKNSLEGLYPLQTGEVKALKAYIKERTSNAPALFLSRNATPISRRRLDELMKHYGERAGIPESKRHFHALKYSIATHLLDAGADLRFVQDWKGTPQLEIP
jgi:site-specific recombinase XerD